MAADRAYFDHAATSPMRAEALAAVFDHLAGPDGNPSGGHQESRLARRALEDARDRIAWLLGADSSEVVFTSGGTEADNLAVVGAWEAQSDRWRSSPGALVCSAIEHHAVLNACRALAARSGAELREVRPGKDGVIDPAQLADACTDDVGLVSVMTVNNEIGTVQPLASLAEVVRRRSPRAVLHTDAVQAVSWLDVSAVTAPADLVTVSAHKFGGPKGIGALVVRNGTGLRAQMHGGGQERERRSGTPDVARAVGMAAALAATDDGRPLDGARIAALRDRLAEGLLRAVPGVTETGAREDRVAGILHVRIAGVEGEALVVLLDEAGVAVSAGAACSSGAVEPSHVLEALGLGPEDARSGVRFSLGASTTDDEADRALEVIPGAIARLRD
jgi:cysteine desulfurase